MRGLFISLSLALGVALCLVMVAIVQDVLPYLNDRERAILGAWPRSWGGTRFDRALRSAWREHTRLFPKSRKRLFFACLLLGVLLSVMAYPVWLALGPR